MNGYYSPYADGDKRCSWTRGQHRCGEPSVATILRENTDIGEMGSAYGICLWHAQHTWEEKPVDAVA